jgi:hypothetical protein
VAKRATAMAVTGCCLIAETVAASRCVLELTVDLSESVLGEVTTQEAVDERVTLRQSTLDLLILRTLVCGATRIGRRARHRAAVG